MSDNACQGLEHVFINNFTHVAVSPFANLVRSTLRRCTRPLFILSICLHFFLSLSFLLYSLVWIFCPRGQFCSAIGTVREDAISGKTSGSILRVNYINALIYFRFFFYWKNASWSYGSRKFHVFLSHSKYRLQRVCLYLSFIANCISVILSNDNRYMK